MVQPALRVGRKIQPNNFRAGIRVIDVAPSGLMADACFVQNIASVKEKSSMSTSETADAIVVSSPDVVLCQVHVL